MPLPSQKEDNDVELDQLLSSSPRGSFYSLRTVEDDERDREHEPLISSSSNESSRISTPRNGSPRPVAHYASTGQSSRSAPRLQERKRDAPGRVHGAKHAVRNSRIDYIVNSLAVESEPGLSHTQLLLTNTDLSPVPSSHRIWGSWNFVSFWIADSFNINTWMISSSMITAYGLSWWQSWLCVWIGYSISACFICLTGRIGATYHIGFPVVARSSFGIWGSLWPVFNRAGMACVWYGVQAWLGGNCVKIMISSIWSGFGSSVSASGELSRHDFVAFAIFWLLSLPAIWFPVHKIKHLFTIKAWFVPIAGLAYFCWAIIRAGGLGPIVRQPNKAEGSDLAWGIVKGIMNSIANFATLIINNPDFARFARKPSDQYWSQLLTIPISFAVTSFVGIIVSSSSAVIYGEAVWNPLDLLARFLENAGSSERVGILIIAFAFALAQLGTNIAANSIAAGTDLTALMPRYLNIRRGGYICAVVGVLMCPWNLLKSSNNFLTYLSAYSVFLSSVAGVMVCDYYFVRKGFLDVKELYSGKHTGPYYFWHGINWRGYAAYLAGISINIVGFAGALGAHVPRVAMYIYNLNFFGGFLVAAITYWLINRVAPVRALSPSGKWMEVMDDSGEDVHVAEDDSDVERGDYAKISEEVSDIRHAYEAFNNRS